MTGGGDFGSIMNNRYGVHETLELHEVTSFKTLCMTKSKTMQALVSDPELKALMQQDVQLSTRQLQELSGLLSQSIH
jgi:similar to spore coat protein